MSHFTVLVIGHNPEAQLAPYNEDASQVGADRLTFEDCTEDARADYAHYLESGDAEFKSYKEYADRYYQKHKDGRYGYWRNEDAKWDWYELGGRWHGKLILKPGRTGLKGEDAIARFNAIAGKAPAERDPRGADQAHKGDLDLEAMDDFSTFAVVKDGEWFESGSMGWWGIVTNENSDWSEQFKQMWAAVPDDEIVSVYDCHI